MPAGREHFCGISYFSFPFFVFLCFVFHIFYILILISHLLFLVPFLFSLIETTQVEEQVGCRPGANIFVEFRISHSLFSYFACHISYFLFLTSYLLFLVLFFIFPDGSSPGRRGQMLGANIFVEFLLRAIILEASKKNQSPEYCHALKVSGKKTDHICALYVYVSVCTCHAHKADRSFMILRSEISSRV